jgi:hypothetical protein
MDHRKYKLGDGFLGKDAEFNFDGKNLWYSQTQVDTGQSRLEPNGWNMEIEG